MAYLPVVGIDIGSSSVKLAVVERSSTGWILTTAASHDLPTGAVTGGTVNDVDAVASVISQITKDNNIRIRTATTAVEGTGVVVREVSVPHLAKKTLDQSIRFEAQKHLTFPLEDCMLGYTMLPRKADSSMQDILLAMVPNTQINGHINAITQAGYELSAVDISLFCLERAYYGCIKDIGEDRESSICILDVGDELTSLYIKSPHVAVMIRTVGIGMKSIVAAMSKELILEQDRVRNLIKTLNLHDLLHHNIGDSIYQSEDIIVQLHALHALQVQVDDLLREVRRSIQFHQSNINDIAPQEKIQQISLCGALGYLPSICEYMGIRLGVEVKLALPIDYGFINVAENSNIDTSQANLLYGVAIGCSMHQWAAEQQAKLV